MIDVHNHFLPNLDDGCDTVEESLECLRLMVATGYERLFCTPHAGSSEFSDLSCASVKTRVATLQAHADAAGIAIQIRPGAELRLTQNTRTLEEIPTFGHAGKYVLADIWEPDWPKWAYEAVEFLQSKKVTVILAHPERMPVLRKSPEKIQTLANLGILFQGNLGPIAGADSKDIVALAQRFLQDGRYFMVGTDGHHISHLATRLAGLKMVEKLVGAEALEELTVRHPGRLWS